MEGAPRPPAARPQFPVILIAAVAQGWALYGLHQAIKTQHWPATQPAWLLALYAVAVFAPLTVELLAEYTLHAALWRVVAILTGACFYFGWHQGAAIADSSVDRSFDFEFFPFVFLLMILWLLVLPFLQSRLAERRWMPRYESLFASAWRNKLTLAEAALFTGGFWLLLSLWGQLFHLLTIDFFRDLFAKPLFVYPITCITFGVAVHLIGAIDRLTSVVLEQILNVLKWLALLAGIILALFTIALLLKLPGLVFTGQKAIGANWLLWLIAVVVLLLNAAYRDGRTVRPYPKWIGLFLRVVVPLAVIVALTALYALVIRSRQHGLTVERFWAFVVAGAALFYSVGYAVCAAGKRDWFAGISRVNTAAAIGLIAVLCAALTPVLSPYRLAANSQYRRALQQQGVNSVPDQAVISNGGETSFRYLRFHAGRYGRERLEELAKLQDRPNAELIRALAQQALDQKNRWGNQNTSVVARAFVDKLKLFPAGHVLDPGLAAAVAADLQKSAALELQQQNSQAAGLFIDLKGDSQDEFVFLGRYNNFVYEKRADGWVRSGSLLSSTAFPLHGDVVEQLDKGNFSAAVPGWRELHIGSHNYFVNPQ